MMMLVMMLEMMMVMMMMLMMMVELSRRVDGQASDWRTGSVQEALPPQHTADPSWNQNIFRSISKRHQRCMKHRGYHRLPLLEALDGAAHWNFLNSASYVLIE